MPADAYCGKCGARQPRPGFTEVPNEPPRPMPNALQSLNPNHVDRVIPAADVDWIARIVWASQ